MSPGEAIRAGLSRALCGEWGQVDPEFWARNNDAYVSRCGAHWLAFTHGRAARAANGEIVLFPTAQAAMAALDAEVGG